MNSEKRLASIVAAVVGSGLVVVVLIALLSAPRTNGASHLQSSATTLASRIHSARATSVTEAFQVVKGSVPAGEILRVSSSTGNAAGGLITRQGAWSTAIATTQLAAPAGAASGPTAYLALSAPAASLRELNLGRGAVIVACACALLAIALLLSRRRGRGAVTREHGPDHDLSRSRAVRPVHLGETPNSQLQVTSAVQGGNGDRRELVAALMAVVDTSADERAVARARTSLAQVGVETIEPRAGDSFDPNVHCVIGVVGTSDHGLYDSVVALVRPGYRDRGRVLREADVQVYGAAGVGYGRSEPIRRDSL